MSASPLPAQDHPVIGSIVEVHVPVGESRLGRLLNVFGEPLDGSEPLQTQEYRNTLAKPACLREMQRG